MAWLWESERTSSWGGRGRGWRPHLPWDVRAPPAPPGVSSFLLCPGPRHPPEQAASSVQPRAVWSTSVRSGSHAEGLGDHPGSRGKPWGHPIWNQHGSDDSAGVWGGGSGGGGHEGGGGSGPGHLLGCRPGLLFRLFSTKASSSSRPEEQRLCPGRGKKQPGGGSATPTAVVPAPWRRDVGGWSGW